MRFPSYSSEWHSYTLGEILTFYSTNSFSREKLNYDTGSVKNIHYGDIHTKFPSIVSIDNNKDIPFINDDLDLSKFSEDQYLREGDLIIADASEDYEDIGKAIEVKDINNEKVLAGLHTILARDENDMAVNGFKAYLFSTNNLKTKIKIIANGISVLGISKNNLSKLNVEIPSKKEQQNIVSFISDIDKKIELLEKKHQLYLDFKNYLMQQIFAQKLRFADSDSCWKEISLKDIGTFYRGHSYNSTNVADEGLLVLRSNNIQGNVLDFSEDGLQFVDKDCKKELELQKNDIVICMSNGTRRLVGKSAEYTGNYENKVTVGAFCSIFRTKNKLAKYLFQTESYKKNLYLILAGTNINNLKNSDLEKFKFNIPTNESEINKIHDLFVSIDNKIDYNKKQLEEITLFKKGLLQQMFVVQLILSLLQNKKHI
ncbi:restriction endonuclease subunit S [Methanobrevibacter smithii]|uniref:restriction endonuclease subunit S n=1 Tax=Methanobrevibacter smithii TaxID=2173 RepID=UPI0037DC8296